MTFLNDSVHSGHSSNGLITPRKSHTFFNDVSLKKSKSVVIGGDLRKCCALFGEVTPLEERGQGVLPHVLCMDPFFPLRTSHNSSLHFTSLFCSNALAY